MDIFAEIFAEIDRLKPKLRKVGGEDATMTTEEVREKFDALANKIIELRHQAFNKELDDAVIDFYLAGGAASPVDSTGLAPIRKIAHFAADWQKEKDTRDMYMSDNRHFQKVYELGKEDALKEKFAEGDEEIRKELIVHLEQEAASATLTVNRKRWKEMLDYVYGHLK